MSRGRRIVLAVSTTVLVITALGVLAWTWWIPDAIADRAREAAARRGLDASVASVSLGFDTVRIFGLRVRGGDAIVADVREVDTHAGVVALALEGSGAVRRISLEGVRISVDLGDSDLPDVLERLRSPRAEAARSDGAGRALEVTDLAIALSDQRGALLVLEQGEVALLPEGIVTAQFGAGALAPDADDGVNVGHLSGRLERDDEAGWRLAGADASEIAVRYREREGARRSPLRDRLADAAAILRGALGETPARLDDEAGAIGELVDTDSDRHVEAEVEPESDDPSSDETRSRGARSDEARPSRPRVARTEETVSAEDGDAESDEAVPGHRAADAESDSEPGDEPAGLAALIDLIRPRLAVGALIRLEGISVVASGDRDRRVLRELEAELEVLPGGRYRLEGSGRPGRGGRLGWNLTVDPGALRAEGDLDFQRLPFVLLVPFLPRLPWHEAEDTRVSGELSIHGEGASRIHLEGQVSIDDLALSSPRIAPNPVERIALSIQGSADWVPLDRRLEIESAELGLGQARVNLTGALEWPADHYRVDVRATLPPTDCDLAVGAIPADLLAELSGFTFTGRIGGQLLLRVDSRDLGATRLRVHVANGCIFDTAPAIADVRRFEAPFIHRVVEPDGGAFEMETGPGTLEWTPITRISPYFIQAVLGHEDAGFYQHSGFSVSSIERALVRNLEAGRYVYGASTITMQLVKNVFLHREKTLARKVQEVLLTWWIESIMEKDQILELYLNVIEYGPRVYGIRAAAMHYFGRIPAELGPAESAYLATILPNPKAFHEHWEEGMIPERHRRRVERFVNTLEARDRFSQSDASSARADLPELRFHRPGDPLPARREQDDPMAEDAALEETQRF